MIRWFYIISLAFLFACDTTSNVQPPNKNYFIKYFGRDGDQFARDLIVNKDGTFFILGNSKQSGGSTNKVYLAKANSLGELIQQVTYGVDMDARDIVLTSDGKLAIVANKNVSSTNVDILLTRFTLDLTLLDSALVFAGSSNVSSEQANSLVELSDGGFIIEGLLGDINQSDELHLRVDNQLKKFAGPGGWTETFGAGQNDEGVKIFQHSSGEFYIFGATNALYAGINNNKFWAYAFGYNGTPTKNGDLSIFEKTGTGLDNKLTDTGKVPSGGYILVGISSSANEDNLKVTITVGTDTAFTFTPAGVAHDVILKDNSATPASLLGKGSPRFATVYSSKSNYNLILANRYNTPSGKSDILLMKVNNALVPMWGDPASQEANYVQFGGDGDDSAAAVAELPDGHIMVLGTMQLGNPPAQFKIALMKLNPNGKLAD